MSDFVDPNDYQRISVSRDALRADLAEMELRLKTYIAMELDKKAPYVQFERLAQEFYELKRHALVDTGPFALAVRNLEDGTFSKAQNLAIIEMINEVNRTRASESWSLKDRVVTGIGTLIAAVALFFTIYYSLHTAHPVRTNTTTGGKP